MKLDDIVARIRQAPTVMDLEREREFMDLLMKVPAPVIHQHFLTFNEVMTNLADSHLDAYFDIDNANKEPFVRFAAWLEQLAMSETGDRASRLRQLAERFEMDPRDFEFN